MTNEKVPAAPVNLFLRLIEFSSAFRECHMELMRLTAKRAIIRQLNTAARHIRDFAEQCEVIGFSTASMEQLEEYEAQARYLSFEMKQGEQPDLTKLLHRLDYLEHRCRDMANAIINLNTN